MSGILEVAACEGPWNFQYRLTVPRRSPIEITFISSEPAKPMDLLRCVGYSDLRIGKVGGTAFPELRASGSALPRHLRFKHSSAADISWVIFRGTVPRGIALSPPESRKSVSI